MNQTKNLQKHIDFLFKLRDRYPSVRIDVDKYVKKLKVAPSRAFQSKRVVANTAEIEDLLKKHSIAKKTTITNNYTLDLNPQGQRKLSKFLKDCWDYQMPKIKKLNIMNINKFDTKTIPSLNRFLSFTMASHIMELFFGASKEIEVVTFNEALSKLLRKVFGEKSKITFFRIAFGNNDLKNVFENIPEASSL